MQPFRCACARLAAWPALAALAPAAFAVPSAPAAAADARPSAARGLGRGRPGRPLGDAAGAVPAALLHLRSGLRGGAGGRQRAGGRGVRDGAGPAEGDYDPESFGEGQLPRNSFAHEFDFLDNMEPTAPMDSVSPPSSVASLSPGYSPADRRSSVYIPPYRVPDAFPGVEGENCECETPPVVPPTAAQNEWAEEVAQQLGVAVADLPAPMSPRGATTCNCTNSSGEVEAYHWVNVEPVPNSRRFIISPADITYSAGNYWEPHLVGGLASPQDKMPMAQYPLQARADRISPLPATSHKDRIGVRFARYIDQVEARSRICDGDSVSERCTTPCSPADAVVAEIGSVRIPARIVSALSARGFVVEYSPAGSRGAAGAAPCSLGSRCSSFRLCRPQSGFCVEMRGGRTRDYLGNLQSHLACPAGTTACSTVQQIVASRYLHKEDRVCRPSGPPAEEPPAL